MPGPTKTTPCPPLRCGCVPRMHLYINGDRYQFLSQCLVVGRVVAVSPSMSFVPAPPEATRAGSPPPEGFPEGFGATDSAQASARATEHAERTDVSHERT